MKRVLLAVAIWAATFESATSQTFVSPADRQAQLSRVEDGLNSGDQATRISTLEAAVAANDPDLRQFALNQSIAQTKDPVLRGAAFRAIIGSAASFVVTLTKNFSSGFMTRGGARIQADGLAAATGGSFEVHIANFDRTSGTFRAYSSFSVNLGKLYVGDGTISGQRLSFRVPGYDYADVNACSGTVILSADRPVLVGSMACPAHQEAYSIEVNLFN